MLDKITARDEFMHAARASAKLELAEWVRANGLKDIARRQSKSRSASNGAYYFQERHRQQRTQPKPKPARK
jgi:hypothetical protein